jgi:hypothetical protein
MSGEFSGTIVVGVGDAGITVLSALAAGEGLGWEVASDIQFEYVAVAADPEVLNRAPDEALEVKLSINPAAIEDSRSTYPYLPPVDDITGDGTGVKRPIGRYALDSRNGNSVSTLRDALESTLDTLFAESSSGRSGFCNIIHVHTMDDGIGSGTFPLVAHIVDEVIRDRREQSGIMAYTAGIGVVPTLSHGFGSGFDAVVPSGERWRFANTYAALKDLEALTEANPDDPLSVFRHAGRKHSGDSEFVLGASEPQGCIDSPPYRHYFFVESRNQTVDALKCEGAYSGCVEEIVSAVYGLTTFGGRTNTWLPPPTGTAHFGAIGQTRLSLPIEDIREYCRLTDQVNKLENRIDAAGDGGERAGGTPESVEDVKSELTAVQAKRETLVEQLTTPEYGPNHGRLALDEEKLRHLDRETLDEELTSLSAFYEAGYLARDLQAVMTSRLPLAYAWQSRLLTWSGESATGTVGGHYGGRREVWMLHSDANTTLPEVNRTGVGQHTFRRSGSESRVSSAFDPYAVQFLSFCIEAPLSDFRLYAELDDAAGGRLDALLEDWDDHRVAFAYPEWHDIDVRQYFGIRTQVALPRPPELDLEAVRIERSGEALTTWLSSHGLASYLWLSDEWNRYRGYLTTHGTEPIGWRAELSDHGLTYHDMRAVVPNGEPVARWFRGELSWGRLLSKITTELAEREGLCVTFMDGNFV